MPPVPVAAHAGSSGFGCVSEIVVDASLSGSHTHGLTHR